MRCSSSTESCPNHVFSSAGAVPILVLGVVNLSSNIAISNNPSLIKIGEEYKAKILKTAVDQESIDNVVTDKTIQDDAVDNKDIDSSEPSS